MMHVPQSADVAAMALDELAGLEHLLNGRQAFLYLDGPLIRYAYAKNIS